MTTVLAAMTATMMTITTAADAAVVLCTLVA